VDSPGLEDFYTKEFFVCEGDGRPKWCSECANWKPDRAHHSRDVGRCVRKFDHFCPWVGGVVAENSFKFFLQFVTYTWWYCTFLLVVMAYYLHDQNSRQGQSWDRHFAAIIGLAAFFGLFTFGMTCSSGHFAIANLTTVENLNRKTCIWQLAVLVPRPELRPDHIASSNDADLSFRTVTYPLPLAADPLMSASTALDSISQDSRRDGTQSGSDPQSERDAKATRTFAILQLKEGLSPWDLGALANWKSVMGNNVLDWFLPIKRSPCCNHDDGEAQYAIGRWVECLMADQGFISTKDVRKPRPFSGHKLAAGEPPVRMRHLKRLNAEGVPIS